jgi:hypothetical protein
MKGYIYTLEVLLAISIILGSIFLIMGGIRNSEDYRPTSVAQQMFDALKYMDTKGTLRASVDNNNTLYIKNNLTALLPETIKFAVAVCTTDCSSTATPNDRTVFVLDYFIAGYKDVYLGKRVHVWVWEKY